MKNDRRTFIKMAAISGGVAPMLPLASSCAEAKPKNAAPDYSALDKVLQLPVLKRKLFPSPVIIEKIELLQDRKNFICRLTSQDGAVGIPVGHSFIAQNSYPPFLNILIPFFTGKDALNLDEHINVVSESRMKNQGIPFFVQMATLEFAILDMLGNFAGLPAGRLLGEGLNPKISIYLGHLLSAFRNREPEESLELMQKDVQVTKAKGIKQRAGRGDNLASVCLSLEKYNEFKMFETPDANGTIIPIESRRNSLRASTV